jgi:hypothetical protein
MRRIEYKEVT